MRKWDDRAVVEADFPETDWERVNVSHPEEGLQIVGLRAMQSNAPVFAEARWFAPDDGVILIRRSRNAGPAEARMLPKARRRSAATLVLAAIVVLTLVWAVVYVAFFR